ncbi:hypothetical protein IV454_18750 [Massilia antarctica]|uniref:Uncharacterized protein n=1 Tax=Massilia antarctica TaxID=2765360 RepID=A0AA49A5L4_9BURK|nr:hypothetical protein [Massilia antarctica]QPI47628.1 hypothetical protein IV454_18750 [Massilia antarctica]
MNPRPRHNPMPLDLAVAIGLLWGHLNTGQFEPAYRLGRVCRQIWPDDQRLALLVAYAQVELFDGPDPDTAALLARAAACPSWSAVLARRCGTG